MLLHRMLVIALFLGLYSLNIRPTKIVGLIGARNEAPIIANALKGLALHTDAIVCLDDASEDETLAIMESLSKSCRIEKIIRKTEWKRDEPGDKNLLLQAGRAIGGTHFIILDADELLSTNCLKNNALHQAILSLKKGEKLCIRYINMWRDPFSYRDDQSVWCNRWGDVIFCDDGVCSYDSAFIHTSRSPNKNRQAGELWMHEQFVVLHYQFANWRNLLVKQAWYRCLEHIRLPSKSVAEINTLYAPSKNERNLRVSKVKDEWIAGYDCIDFNAYLTPQSWREKQVLTWFEQYGKEHFAGLDIWDIDWDKNL